MTPDPTSGKDQIREAVRNRKGNIAILARDIGVAAALLDSFAVGNADLPLDKLQFLVDDLWHGYVEYNAELDKLQPVPAPPARSLGTPPVLTMTLPKYQPGPNQRGGPQPVEAAPKPKPKPGWANILVWG